MSFPRGYYLKCPYVHEEESFVTITASAVDGDNCKGALTMTANAAIAPLQLSPMQLHVQLCGRSISLRLRIYPDIPINNVIWAERYCHDILPYIVPISPVDIAPTSCWRSWAENTKRYHLLIAAISGSDVVPISTVIAPISRRYRDDHLCYMGMGGSFFPQKYLPPISKKNANLFFYIKALLVVHSAVLGIK